MDISFILPSLAVGGANVFPDGMRHHKLDAEDIARLRMDGITHILSVREYDDGEIDGVLSFWVPTENAFEHINATWMRLVLTIAIGAMALGKLYVYCNEGLDRSPSAVYGILRYGGMTKEEAVGTIRAIRPHVRLPYIPMVDLALEQMRVA